jgi:TPR repeat protein
MYAEGAGVEKSYGRAAEWFRKAGEQGDVRAQQFLDELAAKGFISTG